MSRHPKTITQSFAGGEVSPAMLARPGDAKVQQGASKIQNMLVRAQGAAFRRPGSQLVREVKDSSLDEFIRLIPFVYSLDQTMQIEAGRWTDSAAGRDVGYFRFHTNGSTLLYDKPADYISPKNVSGTSGTSTATTAATMTDGGASWTAGAFAGWIVLCGSSYSVVGGNTGTQLTGLSWTGGTPAGVSSYTLIGMAVGTSEVDTGSAHGLSSGDPIVITMEPTQSVTFDSATNYCLLAQANRVIAHGSVVVFTTSGGGALPSGLVDRKLYYAFLPDSTGFRVSEVKWGTPVTLGTAGSGTRLLGSMPVFNGASMPQPQFPYSVVYAIASSSTRLQLAGSKASALAGSSSTMLYGGVGSWRVHRAYEPGDIVYDPGVFSGVAYCMKRSWGELNATSMELEDHLGHVTTEPTYWGRISGDYNSTLTVNASTNTIDWGSTHGFNDGDPVVFNGSPAPGGLTAGQTFYVINGSGSTFQLSATPFGEVVDITSAGTSVTAFARGFYEVPHYYTEEELEGMTVASNFDVISIASGLRPLAELRRLGATKWVWSDVTFSAKTPAPNNLACLAPFAGEGMKVTNVAGSGPSTLTTTTAHNFAKGEPVSVSGLSSRGISDGDYLIHPSTVPGSSSLSLMTLESGDAVSGTAGAASSASRIRSTSPSVDTENSYVVTSIDEDGEESSASNEIAVDNNLFVDGAYNPLTWSAVVGAQRYRVYKGVDGLFGLIGETDTPGFTDDNIEPDTSVSPPINDTSLYRRQSVSISTTEDTISWPSHGMSDGDPVLFDTNGDLPTGIEVGTPYYVFNAGPDSFQVTATRGGTVSINLTTSPRAPSGAAWCIAGAFPSAVAFFEQRRVLAGPLSNPRDTWMTASGTDSDMSYSLPTVDSDRIRFRASAYEAIAIRHAVPLSQLVLLSDTTELRVTPVNDDAITPTSISVRPQTYVGASKVQPCVVNNVVVFAAARGGHVREFSHNNDAGGYLTGDLCLRSSHLFDGLTIRQQAYQKAPIPLVWFASSSGKLITLTYVPEEQVGAWHQHPTQDGTFEGVSVTPESDEDRVYVIARRGTKRYVERLATHRFAQLEDCFYVDNGITYLGSATTQIIVKHLAGKTVNYLANGVEGTATVSATGVLTLAAAATKVHVGIPMVSELQTTAPVMQVDALGAGRTKNVTEVFARVEDSGTFYAGPSASNLSRSPRHSLTSLLDGMIPVNVPGSWSQDGQIVIRQASALPLTVLGVTVEVASGG